MKPQHNPFLRLMIPALLLVALLAVPALAQAGLQISGVQPSSVNNSVPTTLVITGSGFDQGAVVLLEGYGALDTTFSSASLLTAVLPSGVPAGTYAVTVVNSDSSHYTLQSALKVNAPEPTTQPGGSGSYLRPVVTIQSYNAGASSVTAGQDIDLVVKLHNAGQGMAFNVVATFTPGDFVPRVSGGVKALQELDPDETAKITQPLTASRDILGKSFATVVMVVAYTDESGTAYTETFNINIPVTAGRGGPYPTATPTPTPTSAPVLRPQLVITGYGSDVDILQPGFRFNLELQVNNVGNIKASRVTMILGGGSGSAGAPAGTPDASGSPGGVTGGSGDFGNFAPVAASNVQYLGDLAPGASLNPKAALIVNASTNPGAYPMKISFTYTGENGRTFTDDQVVTLLVYSVPQVEVNFYRDPGPLFAGQPNQLPLQVVNLGRKPVVLGNMKVTAEGAEVSNNTTLIGALDTGGYFTLDAMLIPSQPGPMKVQVTINYTDDFNQAQQIVEMVDVDVMEAAPVEPIPPEGGAVGPDGGPVMPEPAAPETFWQKVTRFFRGLFGLDSGVNTPAPVEPLPAEPQPGNVEPAPVVKPGPKG